MKISEMSPTQRASLDRRFSAKVNRDGPVQSHCRDLGPCHEWTGAVVGAGYGNVWAGDKPEAAHRVAWEMANGDVPFGLFVLHRCDYKRCVNAAHLFIGTDTDNRRDCMAKGRDASTRLATSRACRGENGANSKLMESDIREIRSSSDRGVDLARKYNVTPENISAIRARRTWRHVATSECVA